MRALPTRAKLVVTVAAGLFLAAPAGLAAGSDAETEAERHPTSDGGWVTWFVPHANFYPHYIANPLRPQSALMVAGVPSTTIPDAGDSRFILRLGGGFPMVRWHPRDDPDRGWQLDFEGGFFGVFDVDHSLDNIGWDGIFGLLVSWRPGGAWSFRAGTLHDSAHVGDEYAERTGRERIGYTREELVLGVSWEAGERWRLYAEGGYDREVDHPQEPWRVELGAEYHGVRRFWKGRLGWYAAVDVNLFQERDWRPSTTAQLGFVLPTGRGNSRYRFALEVADGRSILGEFSFHDESYVALGWYFDF